jgi:copper chaperone CopZ
MKKIKITIDGMHCASRASNVEQRIKKINGVKEVNDSMMLNKGTIEMEDSVSVDEIKKAVVKVGYKVSKVDE